MAGTQTASMAAAANQTVILPTPDELLDETLAAADAALDAALAVEMLAEDAEAEVELEITAVEIVAGPSPALPTIPTSPTPSLSPPDLSSPDRFAAASLPPAPIQPGSPQSPYRRCSCLGVMPGRACTACNNTRWLKVCQACSGEGIITANNRLGSSPRRDRCGFCMGRGSTPATFAEVAAASLAWDEFCAAGGQAPNPFTGADGKIARGPKLPTPPKPAATHAHPSPAKRGRPAVVAHSR